MKKVLVYDWPIRLFHFVFAGLFIGAFSIAEFVDDESALFSYHMIMGIIMVFVVFLRLIWGLIGSHYGKFSSFELHPNKLLCYFKDMLSSQKKGEPGHNPASSWAAIIMMALTIGLGVSGYMMSQDIYKDTVEDVHELFANGFLIVVIAHIAGIILHTLRHKDAIGMSMVHGKKSRIKENQGISSSHGGTGILFLLLVGLFASQVVKNYDSTTRNLNLFGATIQLGESESKNHGDSHDDEDNDDD